MIVISSNSNSVDLSSNKPSVTSQIICEQPADFPDVIHPVGFPDVILSAAWCLALVMFARANFVIVDGIPFCEKNVSEI